MTEMSNSIDASLDSFSDEQAQLLALLLEEAQLQGVALGAQEEDLEAPASQAQQRLWFLDQIEGAGSAYHVPVTLRMTGALDVDALRRALDAVLCRHESLRTVFIDVEGELKQQVLDTRTFPFTTVALQTRLDPADEPHPQVELDREAAAPFDLRHGPVVRAKLLQLGAEDHTLIITLHHIVTDGWSIGVLIDELAEHYCAYRENRRPRLPALPLQYTDHARKQVQSLRTGSLRKSIDYWRDTLIGGPPQLELPADYTRPEDLSYRGSDYTFTLGASLSAQLRSFALARKLTPFMVLYAVYAMLLAKLSGQQDLIIGTPVANRPDQELEGLIGLFVNTVALRSSPKPDTTGQAFLEEARAAVLAAFTHQNVPFELVVELVRPERRLNRNPLFQTMFIMNRASRRVVCMTDLAVEVQFVPNQTAKFDLILAFDEHETDFAGTLNFATDLFDAATIERWSESFRVLLQSLMSDPGKPIGALQALSELERAAVIGAFNQTHAPVPRKSVQQLFEQQAAETPEVIALLHGSSALSYRELNERSNQVARYLIDQGVAPGHVVGICLERGNAMVVALLGILKAGAAYLPLDPNYPPERLEHMLQDARPSLVLTQTELWGTLPQGFATLVMLDRAYSEIDKNDKQNLTQPPLEASDHGLVYVIYTSGSTGRPKGTRMPHHAMANLLEWHRATFARQHGVRVSQFAAISFDVGFQEIFTTLCTGATLVLLDEWVRRDILALEEFLRNNQIERLFLPPMMLQTLAQHCTQAGRYPGSVTDVIVAGEQLFVTQEVRQFFTALTASSLHNHYGPTETHVVTALTLSCPPTAWPDHPSIVRPIANTAIYILDASRAPVPIGVTGEIHIGGAGLADGYHGQPELTAQRFIIDSFSAIPGARMYKTGDLACWRGDGTIDFLGRNDDQVKIRGFRVELGEIEAQLAKHPAVKEAAVIAKEAAAKQKCLVAYLTLRAEERPKLDDLRSYLKGLMPEFMIPAAFVILQRLPLSPNGKLDRRALPAPDQSSFVTQSYTAPTGELEEALAVIWQQLLGMERVGRDDNFFELGGHSMHAIKLAAKISEQLGARVPTAAIFKFPTIKGLATQFLENVAVGASPAGPITASAVSPVDHAPLTHSQRLHWKLNRLYERTSIRQVAAALRLRGAFKPALLGRALHAVVQHHAALRTRIAVRDGEPVQQLLPMMRCDIPVTDLSGFDNRLRESRLQELIGEFVLKPVDVLAQPLFAIELHKENEREYVLVAAMEHLISDAVSLDIFLRDLFTAYSQLVREHAISLQPVSVEFAEYAQWQHNTLDDWKQEHTAYWAERLAGIRNVRFPISTEGGGSDDPQRWSVVRFKIGRELKDRLGQCARSMHTTLVMSMAAAYAALVARWCGTSEALIQYQVHGRTTEELQRTIGFFASVLYLRVPLSPGDTFHDLVGKLQQEYSSAYPHADSYYLATEEPRPAFARTSTFNWVPHGKGIDFDELHGSEHAIDCSPVHCSANTSDRFTWDSDPMTVLFDSPEGILGHMHFPVPRFRAEDIERFAANFVAFLTSMTRNPNQVIAQIRLIQTHEPTVQTTIPPNEPTLSHRQE